MEPTLRLPRKATARKPPLVSNAGGKTGSTT